ncbi:MAG: alpha/beta fold hydrolase [Micromonosporaceae bacterium]
MAVRNRFSEWVARDLDLLRAALGGDVLAFAGWSYGARLGAHYAHLFPDRVRALVLFDRVVRAARSTPVPSGRTRPS